MNDFWNNKVVPTLVHPVLALHAILFLTLNLGFLKVFTTLINQRKFDLESDLRLVASQLSLVFFVVALVAGGMAVAYSLLGSQRPVADDDEGLQQRVKRWLSDPYILLNTGIYLVAYLGLIATVLLMVELRGSGPAGVWLWWSTQMFYTLTGVLVLLAVKTLANSVITNVPSAAPSGAAEEDEAKSSDDKDETVDDESDKGDSAENSEESGPGFADRMFSHVSMWQLQARYGLIAVGYLGALYFVLDMWSWRNTRPNSIWWIFFFDLALVVGAIGVVILLSRLIEVATHSEVTDSDDSAETWANRTVARLRDPGKAAYLVTVSMAMIVGAWALINIWLTRNDDVLDFWSEVLWTLHLAIPAIALPFIFWSLWQVITSERAQAVGTLLFDPYRQLTIVIYLIAYAGMIDFVLHAWDDRNRAPAMIWETAGEDLFNVAARVAVFVVLRAIVAALVIGKNPVVTAVEPPVDNSTSKEPEPA